MNIISALGEKAAWERGELLKRDETNPEEKRDDVLGPEAAAAACRWLCFALSHLLSIQPDVMA